MAVEVITQRYLLYPDCSDELELIPPFKLNEPKGKAEKI